MGKRTSNEVLNVIQGKDSCVIGMCDGINAHCVIINWFIGFSGNTTVDELMMRLMGAMEIFTAQQQEDIKDEVQLKIKWDSEILRLISHITPGSSCSVVAVAF